MPARSIALVLLLLLYAQAEGRAAEPGGATVVLQLPSSMPPEAVRELIADLAAKGAKPGVAPADQPAAAGSSLPTTASLAGQVWQASQAALRDGNPFLVGRPCRSGGGTSDRAGLSRARRSSPDPAERARACAAFARRNDPLARSRCLSDNLRRPVLVRAPLHLDGSANPRGKRRPLRVGRSEVAAVDCRVVDRRLTLPAGYPALGDRRCGRSDMLAVGRGLSRG
jgi:hypothetical protein